MRRIALVLGVFGFAAAVLVPMLTGRPPSPSPPVGEEADATTGRPDPSRAADAPGIVLLCLDTLRADALTLGSGAPVVMPRLEAFARDSVAFADAVAPAAWTAPSVTSLLTGLEPDHTGVFGLYERIGEPVASIASLPQRLAADGFDTAAVVPGGWVDPSSRILASCREVAVGLDASPEASIEGWNRRRPKGVPFFLYLHSLAAHDPYLGKGLAKRTDAGGASASPPAPEEPEGLARARSLAASVAIDGGALSDDDARWLLERVLSSVATRRRVFADLGPSTATRAMEACARWLDEGAERDPGLASLGERLRAAYVEGLAEADVVVGRILDALEAAALPRGTVIAIVGDHGEAFGEHGTVLHGLRLYDEVIRVPLLLHAPGRIGASRVVRGAVGLVDVTPTLLRLAGRPVPAGLDGISLVAVARGDEAVPDRVLRGVEERRRFEGGVEHVERLESVRTPRAKCILRRDPATRRILGAVVYDLLLDPGERVAIPFEQVDQPCRFGEAFATALEPMGLVVPCVQAFAVPTTTGRPGG